MISSQFTVNSDVDIVCGNIGQVLEMISNRLDANATIPLWDYEVGLLEYDIYIIIIIIL